MYYRRRSSVLLGLSKTVSHLKSKSGQISNTIIPEKLWKKTEKIKNCKSDDQKCPTCNFLTSIDDFKLSELWTVSGASRCKRLYTIEQLISIGFSKYDVIYELPQTGSKTLPEKKCFTELQISFQIDTVKKCPSSETRTKNQIKSLQFRTINFC